MTPETPIVIATFGPLVRHDYRTDVSCHRCQQNVTIDAAAIIGTA